MQGRCRWALLRGRHNDSRELSSFPPSLPSRRDGHAGGIAHHSSTVGGSDARQGRVERLSAELWDERPGGLHKNPSPGPPLSGEGRNPLAYPLPSSQSLPSWNLRAGRKFHEGRRASRGISPRRILRLWHEPRYEKGERG